MSRLAPAGHAPHIMPLIKPRMMLSAPTPPAPRPGLFEVITNVLGDVTLKNIGTDRLVSMPLQSLYDDIEAGYLRVEEFEAAA